MAQLFFPLALSGAIFLGCGGSAQGGTSSGPLDVNFTKLTYSAGVGYMGLESIFDACNSGSVVTLDASGNYRSASCEHTSDGLGLLAPATAETQVNTAQMEGVRAAIEQLQIGQSGNCGADKGVESLTVESQDGRTVKYLDDFYSCRPAPDGSVYVRNIDTISTALRALKPPATVATRPFDVLRLTSTGGMPMSSSGGVCDSSYVDTFTFDVASTTFHWDFCNGSIVQGQRVLAQTEIESLASRLALTVKTMVSSCADDLPAMAVTITRDGTDSTYLDAESAGCASTATQGQLFAYNLSLLESLLKSLAMIP
jgi:hypothetical protein